MTTDLVAEFYRLRDEHVRAGGIAVAADHLARDGRWAEAITWLESAKDSDFRN